MSRQEIRHDIGEPQRHRAKIGRLGLTMASTMAVLAALMLPRLSDALPAGILTPGWMPQQIVQLLEYSNDIQVALVADRPAAPHPRIALVLVTDDTLAELPYITPIDRGLLSRIIKALDGLGARVIGVDILFDQPTEPAKDTELLERFKLSRAAVVLGCADERTSLNARRRGWQTSFLERTGRPHGFFNLRYDVREAAQTHVVRNRAAPSPGSTFTMSFAEAIARRVGVREIPQSRAIPWLRSAQAGSDTFLSIDADAVLAADRDPDGPLSRALENQLNGRIVLLGADLTGQDRHPTPLSTLDGKDMLGVAVHAQILAGLLDGRSLTDLPPAGVSVLAAMSAFLGALIGWYAARSRLLLTVLIAAGTFAVVGVSALVLWQFRAIVPVAAIVAVFFGAAMVTQAMRSWVWRV